jgi:HD-like signal output (HDOD) protein
MSTRQKDEILHRLETIETIPTLPIIVRQIEKCMANPRSNMNQIAAIISKDQAISSRVIRLVNSAFYGLSRRISSIQQAIVILGLRTVKNLVLGISVVKAFDDHSRMSSFDREQFWIHSFACAMESKLIAERIHLHEPNDYFMAGLLHDIGLLIEEQYLHDEFIQLLNHSVKERLPFTEVEKKYMGCTHGTIGEYVARKWNLSELFVNTIHFHHDPPDTYREVVDDISNIAVIHIADTAILQRGVGNFCNNFSRNGFSSSLEKKYGITGSILDETCGTVTSEVRQLVQEWGI